MDIAAAKALFNRDYVVWREDLMGVWEGKMRVVGGGRGGMRLRHLRLEFVETYDCEDEFLGGEFVEGYLLRFEHGVPLELDIVEVDGKWEWEMR